MSLYCKFCGSDKHDTRVPETKAHEVCEKVKWRKGSFNEIGSGGQFEWCVTPPSYEWHCHVNGIPYEESTTTWAQFHPNDVPIAERPLPTGRVRIPFLGDDEPTRYTPPKTRTRKAKTS